MRVVKGGVTSMRVHRAIQGWQYIKVEIDMTAAIVEVEERRRSQTC
jgi:hypothetical protein